MSFIQTLEWVTSYRMRDLDPLGEMQLENMRSAWGG